jgi:hypothetical protein
MLLGTVLFVIALFQLVNANDDDIRRYSWKTISTTISIFTAILIYSAINAFLEQHTEEFSPLAKLAVGYVHFLTWILMLQITVGMSSGAFEGEQVEEQMKQMTWVINDSMRVDYEYEIAEKEVRDTRRTKSTAIKDGVRVPVMKIRLEFERRKRRMKMYGTLLAHMAGFAGIHAGGTAQHLDFFKRSPALVMVPVLLNILFTGLVFNMLDHVRSMTYGSSGKSERHHLYDEETEEAENDVISLAVSFLTIQAARFAISGVLPNSLGAEIPEEAHPMNCVISLLFVGFASAVITIIWVLIPKEKEGHGQEGFSFNRFVDIMSSTFSMMFAWCMLFAMRWWFRRLDQMEHGPGGTSFAVESMMGKAFMALVLSLISIALIFFLDKIADNFASAAELITVIINAIAVLVGFSWESAFDFAVEVLASKTSDPTMASLALAIFVGIVIVPIWRKYILKRYLQLEELHAERRTKFQPTEARSS